MRLSVYGIKITTKQQLNDEAALKLTDEVDSDLRYAIGQLGDKYPDLEFEVEDSYDRAIGGAGPASGGSSQVVHRKRGVRMLCA